MKNLIITLMLISAAAFSQGKYRTISGYVHENGTPKNYYHVSLVKITGDPVFVTYPDENGYFEFRVPHEYKGTLFLTLLVQNHKPLKKRLDFPLTDDRCFDLPLVCDGHGSYTINLWKDPDTLGEGEIVR